MPSDMIGVSVIGEYGIPTEWRSTRPSMEPKVFFSDLLKLAKFKSVRFVVQSLHNLFDVHFKKPLWVTMAYSIPPWERR